MTTHAHDEARWWGELHASVNGVFKGGGAKGLLYAGAVEAVAEAGLWFRAVAGSSAGAITAALIASGLEPGELHAAVPDALGKVKKMWLGDLASSPLFRVGGLRDWLEGMLSAQLARLRPDLSRDGQSVTFEQLYDASGIELYVVAVDVARRQPVVFSAFTTPELAIAPAVIASSAIPVAFWPGRLRVVDTDGKRSVHRLSDGGVWANYPMFVFKDASFRAFHQLAPVPEESITIGFTLDASAPASADRPEELITDRKGVASDQGVWSGYQLIGRAPVRLYLFTLVPIVIALQAAYTFDKGGLVFLKDWATRDGVPGPITDVAGWLDGFTSGSVLVVFLYLAVALMIALAIALAILGATLIDSGIPTMRTLMAVGTNVPYWVGYTTHDYVVRLAVPEGLETTSFRLDAAKVEHWIAEAKAHAAAEIATIEAAEKDRRA